MTFLLLKKKTPGRRLAVEGERRNDSSKALPSRQRHDTFHIGTLRGPAFNGIRDTSPNCITLEIFSRSKLFGSFASVSSSRSSMTRYQEAGIHLNRFILRWNPHHAPPIPPRHLRGHL